MIGSAKECDRLYILDKQLSTKNKQAHTSLSDSIFGSKNKIMLWHNKLGHPSFVYLKKLSPSLFINKDALSFHCDTCHFAKHTRTHHPIHLYKPSRLFSLIHSDVWGSSRVNNVIGVRWFVT